MFKTEFENLRRTCPLDVYKRQVLHQPAYTSYQLNLGEISSYPPGYKENAGIFCHNNPWISCAETMLGHGDRAFEVYRKTCPAYIEDISEIHRTEPYVYSQMVAGRDAPTFGEADVYKRQVMMSRMMAKAAFLNRKL